jgi:hypothetical protein
MLELLTVEKLKAMNDGDIFAQGTIVDSPEGINMTRTEKMLDWVACRGQGYHDWAIYCTFSDSYWSEDDIPRWKKVDETFRNLAYLGEPDFRNTLTGIVKDREAQTYLGKKVVAILGLIGVIVGIITGIFATMYYGHK